MAYARLYDRFAEPAPHARANESALYPGPSELLTLRAKGKPDIRLVLRPVRSSDGEALQTYVRGLSPQSRYNRFLGAASELPAWELARALAANGRDKLTLLLTSRVATRETVVGEARVALSCAERGANSACRLQMTGAIWPRLGRAPRNRTQSSGGRHRIPLRRYVADQRGDDRTGTRPWLPP